MHLTLTTLMVGSVSSGYRSIIIREFPMVVLNDPSCCHDQPLGNIETGFRLFDGPVKCTTGACVLMLIVKFQNVKQVQRCPLAWRQDFC